MSKENILNTFFFKSPLEKKSLKLSLFIFSYSCDFALNALFYLNQKISDKYHYEGDYLYLYTLINNIIISIISSLSSFLLVISLNSLIESKDEIEKLFRIEEKKMRKDPNYRVNKEIKKNILKKLKYIFKILKIKIIFYIIIEYFLMLFFFYFVTAFCEVYKNTQISWIIDSIVSFILSIITEIGLSFIYSLLYIIAIKYKNEKLYNLTLFLYTLG